MTKALETLLLGMKNILMSHVRRQCGYSGGFFSVSQTAGATCVFQRQKAVNGALVNTYLVRRIAEEEDFLEVRYDSTEFV